jgi:hypothetical protein
MHTALVPSTSPVRDATKRKIERRTKITSICHIEIHPSPPSSRAEVQMDRHTAHNVDV